MPRSAYAFLFTDWHVKAGNSARAGDWPPFAQNKPPDNTTIRQIAEDINQRVAAIVPADSPYERVQFIHSNVGLEVIGEDGEPLWKNVWAAIVDRDAVPTCEEKLRKVFEGIKDCKQLRGTHARVFVVPARVAKAPPLAAWYANFVKTFNVGTSGDLASMVAGLLADWSLDVAPEVHDQFEKDN